MIDLFLYILHLVRQLKLINFTYDLDKQPDIAKIISIVLESKSYI